MKRRFRVYASKNRFADKSNIIASHLSDKAEEPAYGFRDLPYQLNDQSAAFANTSLDTLNNLWNSMTWMDQAAVEYAIGFMESDGYNIKNVSDIDLESYARQGCSQVYEGNSEPEYENEEWYEEEADFDTVFDYLKARRDIDPVIGCTDIKASEGYRSDNDWLLRPGNKWYAVAEYWDYGDAESGPMVDGDWCIYQAASEDEALALAKRQVGRDASIGDVRLATSDEIEEFYYEISQGDPVPNEDSTYNYGGIIDDEEIV